MKQIAQAEVISTGVDYRHDVHTGRHTLIVDEPADAGGADTGPAPYDHLLASLGACTAITLRMYAQRKNWDLGRFSVALQLFKDRDGNTHIERSLHSSAELSVEQWQRLLDIAEKTPVTLTLKNGAAIQTVRG